MKTKKPKKYHFVRLDDVTYELARKIAYKERKKIIQVIREKVLA